MFMSKITAKTADGKEFKKGMTLYYAFLEGKDHIGRDLVTITEFTLNGFEDWRRGKLTKKKFKVVKDYRDVTFCLTEYYEEDGKKIPKKTRKSITEVKDFATKKKAALKFLKKRLQDEANADHKQRLADVDRDIKWSIDRAMQIELDIQKKELDLKYTISSVELEIAKL